MGDGTTRVLLLGTGAGPMPKPGRNPTAAALRHGDGTYVVDCGNGVGVQLVRAGVPLDSLRGIFITHLHIDHVADFGTLVAQAWLRLRAPVPVYGPPPLARMARQYLELFDVDFDGRVAEEGRRPLAELMQVREVTTAGPVHQDDAVRVSCTPVPHGAIAHAFAYRFDCADRSVVFSGDTAYSPQLAQFARGAHTLVHEAVYLPALSGFVGSVGGGARLTERLTHAHSSVEQAAQVAQQAQVARLVLSPLTPATGVAESDWQQAAASHYDGEVIVGRDLLEA